MKMPQMKAPGIGSVRMRYGNLECGFFRRPRENEGNVYFARPHGRWVFPFPVLENGDISNHSDCEIPYPNEEIVVIFPEEIGISEIKFSEGESK